MVSYRSTKTENLNYRRKNCRLASASTYGRTIIHKQKCSCQNNEEHDIIHVILTRTLDKSNWRCRSRWNTLTDQRLLATVFSNTITAHWSQSPQRPPDISSNHDAWNFKQQWTSYAENAVQFNYEGENFALSGLRIDSAGCSARCVRLNFCCVPPQKNTIQPKFSPWYAETAKFNGFNNLEHSWLTHLSVISNKSVMPIVPASFLTLTAIPGI